ncbi:hypothetical protein FGB62_118g012 [Gracilaria domingensis]|nr:hypothetical protein FGB62_118g012 [Gracilaria domingensis]
MIEHGCVFSKEGLTYCKADRMCHRFHGLPKRRLDIAEPNRTRSTYNQFETYIRFNERDNAIVINTRLKKTVGDIMTLCFPDGWEQMSWSDLKKNHKKSVLKAVDRALNSPDMVVVNQCMSQWAIKSLMEQKLHSIQSKPTKRATKVRKEGQGAPNVVTGNSAIHSIHFDVSQTRSYQKTC